MILIIKLLFSWFPWIGLFAVCYGLIQLDFFSESVEGYLRIAMWVAVGVVGLTILSVIFKPIRWLLGLIFSVSCLLTPWAGKKAANYCHAKEAKNSQ